MKTVKNILDKVTSYASVFIFIMMVLMVTYQVVARYIFSAPSSVTEILTRYSFVWLIIISATYMFGQREHINIAVVKDKLPKKAKRIVNIIIECVTIAFAGLIMVFGGFKITHMNFVQFDSILHIPTGIIYSIIPICGVIIIFYSIYNTGCTACYRRSNRCSNWYVISSINDMYDSSRCFICNFCSENICGF